MFIQVCCKCGHSKKSKLIIGDPQENLQKLTSLDYYRCGVKLLRFAKVGKSDIHYSTVAKL